MSDTVAVKNTEMKPQTIYRKDYQSPAFLLDDIELRFDLFDDHTIVSSHLRVRFNRHNGNTSHEFILNGEELELLSVKINDKLLTASDYTVTDKFLTIHQAPEKFDIEIVVKIYPEKNTALSGLYRPNKTYCTQCEAEGFRRITYFMDHPDVLTRFKTTISADKKNYPTLLSNGNLMASGDLEGGRHWVRWEDPFKKPSYLFALVAGEFDLLEDKFVTQSNRDIELKIYVEKGYRDQTAHAMYSLQEAMRWDEKAFGREYDLDVYMIVAIGDFNMGAMENKGLNIFNTKYILAKPETATDDDYIHILSVVGHEYFHNWSGNRVTCRDWFQLSLKEGLTIFRDQSFTEDTLSRAVMRIRDVNALREAQFPEDAGPLAHPVLPDSYIEINNFYTATIYNKGAEVLRMMQTILGKAMFRKGMDLYFARHDGQAVTIEDFVQTMEDVSGINLQQFRLWYTQAGTPIVKVADQYNPESQTYTLSIEQSLAPTPGQAKKLPMDIPIRMGLLDKSGQEIPLYLAENAPENEVVLHLTKAKQTFEFKNVSSRPIPSLLRNFSAPVKLQYAYSDADLLFLFKHDSDAFNRWEAGQKLGVTILLNLIHAYQNNKPFVSPKELIEMYQYILTHEEKDKFSLAEMCYLPSEKYIGEQMEVVDVEAIHAAREFLLQEIATHLAPLLLDCYKKNHDHSGDYKFNMIEVGKRELKNRCLSYLMLLPKHIDLGIQQFNLSFTKNMTDTIPAFAGIVNSDSTHREMILQQFYNAWKHDALVIDKWLAIQAACKLPNTLQVVKSLMNHEAFDIKNPNKVYALIGTWGHRNAISFHAKNGEGYVFLREVVAQLDKLNPQVAARMVKPLTAWKRYDKQRQTLMREQLEMLTHDKQISTDLYELVTKSLQ